jgi:magnesium chelatase family protein
MNPCPCGYAGDRRRVCACSAIAVARYFARISGPVLDRFDMQVAVPRLPSIRAAALGESTDRVRDRVMAARDRALAPHMAACADPIDRLTRRCEPSALAFADQAVERLGFSARAFVKVLSVAHTIADLEATAKVTADHVAEALQYRAVDRQRTEQDGGIRQ